MTEQEKRAREVLAAQLPKHYREGIVTGENSQWGHIRPREALAALLAFAAEREAAVREEAAITADAAAQLCRERKTGHGSGIVDGMLENQAVLADRIAAAIRSGDAA